MAPTPSERRGRVIAIEPGFRFSKQVKLTPGGISEFARMVGDDNPIHHDVTYAQNTRFGGVLTSGAELSGLLIGLVATRFSSGDWEMVGLEFNFRFKKPITVPQTISIEWLVVHTRESTRLGGTIVELRGRIVTEAGDVATDAKGKVLVSERL